MKIRNICAFALITFSVNAQAFTDGSGYAILTQMVKQVSMMTKQIKMARDNLKLVEAMKAMEEARTVRKTVINEHNEWQSIYDEAKDLKREIGSLANDPFDIKRYDDEIAWYKKQLDIAKNSNNSKKARIYSSILMDLNKVKVLASRQESMQKRLEKGTNEEEDAKVTANNTLMMTELLVNAEERAIDKNRSQAESSMELINQSSGFKYLR